MKIGLDAKRAFHNYTGLGNYSRNVIRGLLKEYPQHEYYLFTPSIKNNEFLKEISSLSNVKIIQPKIKIFTSHWRSYRLTRLIDKLGLDIYHGLSNELPYNIKRSKVKKMVTIHDLIPFKEDVFRSVFDDYVYRKKMRSACKNADTIVSISHATAKDIAAQFGTSEEKIKTIYQPILPKDTDHYTDEMLEVRNQYQLPLKFLLQVGTVEYRKNVQIILKSLKKLKDENLHYVVVGKKKRFAKSLIDFAANSGLKSRVHFIDPVNDDQLACLYLLSTAVVYPSLYEGFGLPIVEALSFGKPVLTTKGSCFEEAGGQGAYYCDTNSVEEVADMIEKMLASNNTQMIELGQKHISKFNLEIATKDLMAVYVK